MNMKMEGTGRVTETSLLYQKRRNDSHIVCTADCGMEVQV